MRNERFSNKACPDKLHRGPRWLLTALWSTTVCFLDSKDVKLHSKQKNTHGRKCLPAYTSRRGWRRSAVLNCFLYAEDASCQVPFCWVWSLSSSNLMGSSECGSGGCEWLALKTPNVSWTCCFIKYLLLHLALCLILSLHQLARQLVRPIQKDRMLQDRAESTD